MQYKVIDVPMPVGRPVKSAAKKVCQALATLQVGQGIDVPNITAVDLTNLTTYAKQCGIKVKREKLSDDTYRFWLAERLNDAPAPVKPTPPVKPALNNTPKAVVEPPPAKPAPAPVSAPAPAPVEQPLVVDYGDDDDDDVTPPPPQAAPKTETELWAAYEPDPDLDDDYDYDDIVNAVSIPPLYSKDGSTCDAVLAMLEAKRGQWVDPTPLADVDGEAAQRIVAFLCAAKGVKHDDNWSDIRLLLPASGGDEYPPHIIVLSEKILDMVEADSNGVTVQRMMKELRSNSNDVEDALDVIHKRIDRVSDTIYFVG